MAKVHIAPMPIAYREIPERLRPHHPPIFDVDPTRDDLELARALFDALDDESRAWYRRGGSSLFAEEPKR